MTLNVWKSIFTTIVIEVCFNDIEILQNFVVEKEEFRLLSLEGHVKEQSHKVWEYLQVNSVNGSGLKSLRTNMPPPSQNRVNHILTGNK